MVGFAEFSRVGFENIEHPLSGRFRVDPRLFGDEGVLLLGVEG
jgi:hypothetical protein